MTAARNTGSLGLPPEPPIELAETPEDHSADVEEDGEQGEHKLENGVRGAQSTFPLTQFQQEDHSSQDEADGVHRHTPHQGVWGTTGCRYREGPLRKAKMTPATKVSSTFSRPGTVCT